MGDLLARCRELYNKEQTEILRRAVDFADKMHKGQPRESGEPYITHPIAVAEILLDFGLDYAAIAAAILHDCVEDTSATEEDIQKEFGLEITALVLGVTKFKDIEFKSKEEAAAENFLKMFFAMAKDIRVLVIKLADRLHNMRTLEAKRPESRIAKARETLEIYAPLASRLGLSYLKCELEDLCLKTLHPDVYSDLVRNVALKREERKALLNQVCAKLKEILKKHGIKGEISGRPKHFYSIYKKMVRDNRTFEQIYDLTAVRVIVNSSAECYEILGAVHSKDETDNWKPIPGRFKDYIAVPKPNNYQSLHTTVMTGYGIPCEIQIRTYEMHRIAEFGIAAHWKYKEKRKSATSLDENLGWLRGIMDEESKSATTPQEFYESIKFDFSGGEIFIFTPKGDVVVLPEGSTPIDFAYAVHSEVGNRCAGCKVNNRIVPLEAKLQTGDYVEILTSNNTRGPSRDWLRFVKTTQAITKIKAFFKKEMKEENIRLGKTMLEEEAKRRGYTLSQLMVSKWLEIIMQRYCISSIDDLYASVGYGGFSVHQILTKLIDFYRKDIESKKQKGGNYGKFGQTRQSVLIAGHDDLLVRLALCCNPVPGDEIVGFISRGRGIAVHRTSCSNLKNVENQRLIEAQWAKSSETQFVVALQIEARNSEGLLAKITTLISEMKLLINNMNARIDKNQNAVINIGVRVSDIAEIDHLIGKIGQMPDVEKVFRSTGV